jgi:two-component system CheB/CheR fusion protein
MPPKRKPTTSPRGKKSSSTNKKKPQPKKAPKKKLRQQVPSASRGPAGVGQTEKRTRTDGTGGAEQPGHEQAGKVPASPNQKQKFSVVGLGASAGGLQAFEEFFSKIPADSGMSFVVVTHQDPKGTSMLPELLDKCASIPAEVIADGMKAERDRIYVSPPAKNVAIMERTFHLMEPVQHRAPHLPVDYFLRSLAQDQGINAICVILSGNGSDGTVGLRAIKAESGLALAQEPRTARFTGMPESAIATGLADLVLAPANMAEALVKYARSPHLSRAAEPVDPTLAQAIGKVLVLVRSHTGHDFSNYKPSTIRRRIERRMSIHHLEDPRQYVRYLESNPTESDILFRELLISVTTFFRDSESFEALKGVALPKLLANKRSNYIVRAWVPGCATGEEAYSVAIMLRECLDELDRKLTFQVFGTDLDSRSIDIARSGLYPAGIAIDLGPERLERYFTREESNYRINKEVRQNLIFATQNLIADPPFTKLDLITCRNVMIYLNSDMQRQVLPLFHYALRPDGLLMLGTSETVGTMTDLFHPVNKKWKIYSRNSTGDGPAALPDLSARQADGEDLSQKTLAPLKARLKNTSEAVTQLLVGNFAPPSVVVNDRGDILHIHGRTGKYLEPAAGRPALNIFKMARPGLQFELPAGIRAASRHTSKIVRRGLSVKTNGGHTAVDLTICQIELPEALRGLFLVSFTDVVAKPKATQRGTAAVSKSGTRKPEAVLYRELQSTKETLQAANEELETANEELKSTNEELQSTNEELQSANEELETSREEMQSLNEELHTVNTELQCKINQLSQSNDDMENLLNGIDVAVVFLDCDLRILRFTRQARRLIKLIETDVGRPLGHLVSTLQSNSLEKDALEVLETLTTKEQEVQSSDSGWFLMRIMPYRATGNVIQGLVITFVDIGALKAMREQMRVTSQAYAEGLGEMVASPLLVLDGDLRIVGANRRFYDFFQVEAGETYGRLIYDLGTRQWDVPELRRLLERILPAHSTMTDFKVNFDFPNIGNRTMLLNARRLERAAPYSALIFLAFQDESG